MWLNKLWEWETDECTCVVNYEKFCYVSFVVYVVSHGKGRKRLLYYGFRNRWYGFVPEIRTLFPCFCHWHAIRFISRRLFAITLSKIPSDKIESKWKADDAIRFWQQKYDRNNRMLDWNVKYFLWNTISSIFHILRTKIAPERFFLGRLTNCKRLLLKYLKVNLARGNFSTSDGNLKMDYWPLFAHR